MAKIDLSTLGLPMTIPIDGVEPERACWKLGYECGDKKSDLRPAYVFMFDGERVDGNAEILRTSERGEWTGYGRWIRAADRATFSAVLKPDNYATGADGVANVTEQWRARGAFTGLLPMTPEEKRLAELNAEREALEAAVELKRREAQEAQEAEIKALAAEREAQKIAAIKEKYDAAVAYALDRRARNISARTTPAPAITDSRQAELQALMDKCDLGCQQAAVTALVSALAGVELKVVKKSGRHADQRYDVVVLLKNPNSHDYELNTPLLSVGDTGRMLTSAGDQGNHAPTSRPMEDGDWRWATDEEAKAFYDGASWELRTRIVEMVEHDKAA
ncbi:hypothetical protein KGP36_02330 [Patescibacteria group bacterium]|nr:hypothetical protein [Patescibacteria group bacterium]